MKLLINCSTTFNSLKAYCIFKIKILFMLLILFRYLIWLKNVYYFSESFSRVPLLLLLLQLRENISCFCAFCVLSKYERWIESKIKSSRKEYARFSSINFRKVRGRRYKQMRELLHATASEKVNKRFSKDVQERSQKKSKGGRQTSWNP